MGHSILPHDHYAFLRECPTVEGLLFPAREAFVDGSKADIGTACLNVATHHPNSSHTKKFIRANWRRATFIWRAREGLLDWRHGGDKLVVVLHHEIDIGREFHGLGGGFQF